MKRASIPLLIFLFSAGLNLPATAQDAAGNAAAIAAKESADERYQRLAADVQTLQTDNEALHAKISVLEKEIQSLRDAQSHPSDTSASTDALNGLADKIREVDKKRQEDKEAISEEIRKSIAELEKSLGSGSGPSRSSAPKTTVNVPDAPPSKDGFSYTIQDGDRLDLIVKAYNKDFKSKGMKTITLRQAMEANPTVDWTRLRVGQKIVIPKPDGS